MITGGFDLVIERHGAAIRLRTLTGDGRAWAERSLGREGWQPTDMGMRVCEPGEYPAVLRAAVRDGLRVRVTL